MKNVYSILELCFSIFGSRELCTSAFADASELPTFLIAVATLQYSWALVIRPPVFRIALLSSCDLAVYAVYFFIYFHLKSCSK